MSSLQATTTQLQQRPRDAEEGKRPHFFYITCEHGGNRIPARYLELFTEHGMLRRSHRGYDPGALRLAREFAQALHAPLQFSTVSRLLVDLNRSKGHPRLFFEATRVLPAPVRQDIMAHYYLPYRNRAEEEIAQAIEDGKQVIHVSCHSFTPELDGTVRKADIGLLYDPARPAEAAFCRRWKAMLGMRTPHMKTRLNYPYKGTSDGFTVYLRRRFPADRYMGIEIEVNQKHPAAAGEHWKALRAAIIASFRDAAGRGNETGIMR